jgi:hypothetical protein
MSQTISDAILGLARQCAKGEDQRAQLGDLLNQAIPATEQQLQSFREHAPHNPEFTDEMVEQLDGGLAALKECFEDLQDMLDSPPSPEWNEPATRLEETVKEIRQAQAAHHESIEDGETSHLFLNRLLVHLQAWQNGRPPGSMTEALVAAVPQFEQELRSFIEEFEDPAVQDRMNAHMDRLMETCQAVADATKTRHATPEDLETWQNQIIQFSQDLDNTLAETVESHLSTGPTPFPVVNLVNAAMDRYFAQLVTAEDLADTMDQCEDWLRSQLPSDTDPALQQAAEELFKVLREMRQTTLEGDGDQLASQRESLFSAAENLAMFAAVLSPEDEVVNLVSTDGLGRGGDMSDTRPMPQLLAQILQQSEAYLAGSQNSDGLEESIQALERLVTSTQGQMARSRDPKEIKERTQEALALLSDASQHLWDFVEKATKERLATIEEILGEAGDVVNSLTPRRR